MVELLLRFVRATSEGNWRLHITSLQEMIPWFFAYDCTNYSRYAPVYLSHMMSLPTNNPAVYEDVQPGDFSVQRNNLGFAR